MSEHANRKSVAAYTVTRRYNLLPSTLPYPLSQTPPNLRICNSRGQRADYAWLFQTTVYSYTVRRRLRRIGLHDVRTRTCISRDRLYRLFLADQNIPHSTIGCFSNSSVSC